MKHTSDYDNVFKTMKERHKRLFISVINETFGKTYPLDAKIEVLPSEGYLTEEETETGEKRIEEQISDFLIKIGNDVFLLECQSYDDDSMAIRIAEYAFITARKFSTWSIGEAVIPMPHFSVIYVKKGKKTPKQTNIRFTFPDGREVLYTADNVILEDFTKEYIIEKKLFPYIPFYIARYETELSGEKDISQAVADLEYFRDEMMKLYERKELTGEELIDLMGFVNTIITHITDGNKSEERLVNVMGGTVIETESERLVRVGKEEGISIGKKEGISIGKKEGISIGKKEGISIGREDGIRSLVEACQEFNLSISDAVGKLISKFGLTESASQEKAAQYWKPDNK